MPASSALDVDVLRANGCVAILRGESSRHLQPMVCTLVEEKIQVMEVSLTTPDAVDSIRQITRGLPDNVYLGAGTVTSVAAAEAAASAGAHFFVTPVVVEPVISFAASIGLPVLVGAFTPTEVLDAWSAGATAVKLFPASLGGPAYCSALAGPLPDIPLVPTGGIDLSDVPHYMAAGATALGIGGPLMGSAPHGGSLAELAVRARQLRTLLDSPPESLTTNVPQHDSADTRMN